MKRFSPIMALLLVIVGGLLAVQVVFEDEADHGPGPWPVADGTPPQALQLGVTTLELARNAYEPWEPEDLEEVDRFEHRVRAHADILMWFADWESTPTFDAAQARAVAARGAIPEISWEPWDSRIGTYRPQAEYRLATIIRGDHDAYLRRWGRALAAYGGPVRIRFAHEMNGRWYPWSERTNGNRAGEYARAWKHVREVVRAQGATNVDWVWCPVAGDVPASLFPGRDQVEILGVGGFNGGTSVFTRRWRTFPVAFGEALDQVHELAPDLPVELSEIASTEEGGDKAAWIAGMFDEIARRDYISAIIWFEVVKESDWRIASSPEATAAFASGFSRVARSDRDTG